MMASKKKRRQRRICSQENRDYISNLPQDVINLILLRLPLKEAVKTSTLSTQWRSNWVFIPDLHLNPLNIMGKPDDSLKSTENYKAFVKIVDQILSQHVGPIRKISLPSVFDWRKDMVHHVDRWMCSLANRSVKELIFKVRNEQNAFPDFRYEIPPSLFYLRELHRLELVGCNLKFPPIFKGLWSLSSLTLTFCSLRLCSKFIGFPSLKKLHLSNVEVNAPKLSNLELKSSFATIPPIATIPPGLCPSLVDVSLLCLTLDASLDLLRANFQSSHQIRSLSICSSLLKEFCLEEFTTTYFHLTMVVIDINFGCVEDVMTTLHLFRSSPNLHKLAITAFCSSIASNCSFWDHEIDLEYSFSHLEVVNILYRANFDLELIRYLLAKAPMLEKVVFYLYSEDKEYEELDVCRQLLQYRRASAKAQIICEYFKL